MLFRCAMDVPPVNLVVVHELITSLLNLSLRQKISHNNPKHGVTQNRGCSVKGVKSSSARFSFLEY